jgi:hypothetical protein
MLCLYGIQNFIAVFTKSTTRASPKQLELSPPSHTFLFGPFNIVTCGPFLGNEWANTFPRRDWFLETSWFRKTVSMDAETENCKHLENQPVAWGLKCGFRDNAFIKNNNGTLGGTARGDEPPKDDDGDDKDNVLSGSQAVDLWIR